MSNQLAESMLIIPKNDNDGHSLESLKNHVALELSDSFGGVTMTDGHGAWKGPDGKLFAEPVTELVSACPETADSDSKLRQLAAEINKDGHQLATYCRFPDGHVEIISA